MFVIQGGEAALIRGKKKREEKKEKGHWGGGGCGRAGLCVGSWHSRAAPNLFCRAVG